MQQFRAKWVLPVAQRPIENGWVSVADGRVAAVGAGRAEWPDETDLGDVALLPAFVNAHTHLELSWLEGRVPPAASMPAWIRAQLAQRASAPSAAEIGRAIGAALASAQASGTALFGDITNTLAAVPVLEASDADAMVFRELLGFNVPSAATLVADAWTSLDAIGALHSSRLTTSVVAHAPYSVAPALFSAIAAGKRGTPLAVHAGESPEEMEFLQTGQGAFRELLNDLGVWVTSWRAPQCGPIEYLDRRGYLGPGMIAVHGTHLSDADLGRLRDARGFLVTCPRSNVWVGGGAPDASRFYASGVPVALGTDSLASTPTLHMLDELAALRRVAPGVPAARLIESATLVGARALGWEADYGSIEQGKRAVFAAVTIPPGIRDVEEYVVGGDAHAAADVRLVRAN
jgi:cytosine/adenosine deaminase-related metal-dependent hydrolase